MLFVISYSLLSPFAQECCWAVWRGIRVSYFYNSLPFKKLEHLVLWGPGNEILAQETCVLMAWHCIGFSWTTGLWMTVPASERQLMQGREGGKEKNMMSSLRTHPSELSGCSESAIYFINIIPSSLTSRLPQQPFPKLPGLSPCLKAAQRKKKVWYRKNSGLQLTGPLLPSSPPASGLRHQKANTTDRNWETGTVRDKVSPVRSFDERKQQNKPTNKTNKQQQK